MDADSILATGGAGGVTGIALFLIYKLLSKNIRSTCCGSTLEIRDQTPKNIQIKVEDAAQEASYSQQDKGHTERPSGSSSSKDTSGTQSEGSSSSKGECCSSPHTTTTNPLFITIPKPIQPRDGC